MNHKLIVVCNVWGFGDNAKYVAQELVRRKEKEGLDFRIVFVTNRWDKELEGRLSPYLTFYKTNSFKAILALATAKVWVDNNRKEPYITKKKGQFYIQTWHGGIALKKIEKDYKGLPSSYVKNAKRDSAMTDLYISNSKFCTQMYQKSFWYRGKILECGSPRNDLLFHCTKEQAAAIRKRLQLQEEGLVIYAPTYRETNHANSYQLDYEGMVEALSNKFGKKFVMAVRLHPLVADQSSELKLGKSVIDVSSYGDLYELMAVSDVVITDFSNIMFEFGLCDKPVFLYAQDIEAYERDRGFYFEYKGLPFPKSSTEEELKEKIKQFNFDTYLKDVRAFFDGLELYETGEASKAVVNVIVDVLDGVQS